MKFIINILTPNEMEFKTLTDARRWLVANQKSGHTTIYKVLRYGDEYVAGYVKKWKGMHVFYEWDDGWKWVINKDGTLGRRF